MRYDVLIVGVLVCLVGLVLVVTHGVVFGYNIPQTLGLPCSEGSNQTFCPGFVGYGIGTVVLLAGLPMVLRGLTTPAMPTGLGGVPMPSGPYASMPGAGAAAGPSPPGGGERRYCPACGTPNPPSSAYCNRCGKPMPAPSP